jgi:hypothetical protein
VPYRTGRGTCGCNGWHPHSHSLVFVEGEVTAEAYAALTLYLRERWRKYVTRAGFRLPSWDHSVKATWPGQRPRPELTWRNCRSPAGSPGNEVARSDLKHGKYGHRTPFEILRDFRLYGDAADLELFREYQRVSKGRQAITWSAGLRRRLLAEIPERTDEEIAAEEVGGNQVLQFSRESWREVTRTHGLATRIQAAYDDGLAAIAALLADYGHVIRDDGSLPVGEMVPACRRGGSDGVYDDDGHG